MAGAMCAGIAFLDCEKSLKLPSRIMKHPALSFSEDVEFPLWRNRWPDTVFEPRDTRRDWMRVDFVLPWSGPFQQPRQTREPWLSGWSEDFAAWCRTEIGGMPLGI
jgi:hypothetical protein